MMSGIEHRGLEGVAHAATPGNLAKVPHLFSVEKTSETTKYQATEKEFAAEYFFENIHRMAHHPI